MTGRSKLVKKVLSMLEKTLCEKNNDEKKTNPDKPISDVLSQEYRRLIKGVNSINQKYDQSIGALKKWERDENEKLEKLKKESDEKFGCQVIDYDDIKLQSAIEKIENEMAKRNEEAHQKYNELQARIDNILKKG